jgi:GT2 family glycosyltransferase
MEGFSGFVAYHDFPKNLGAAGNLKHRLTISSEMKADWVFALNHDGVLDLDVVERLMDVAASKPDVGAIYPLMTVPDGRYELSYTMPFPWRVKRSRSRPSDTLVSVFWGSSNGALYSLSTFRSGARPFVGLWHGWEDFAFGLEIAQSGYPQLMVTDVTLDSRYDYRGERLIGRTWISSAKAPWLTYYFSRNLILIRDRYGHPRLHCLALRILREISTIMIMRGQKFNRVRFLSQGIIDGLQGNKGMSIPPDSEWP